MMKKILFFLPLFVCSLCCVACGGDENENDDPAPAGVSVNLSVNEINAWAPAYTTTISVETNAKEWTAYGSDDAREWLIVQANPEAKTISVSVKENTGEKRQAQVTFKSGQTRKSIPLTQYAPLSVETASVYFTKEGGSSEIAVSFDGDWSASPDADWLTASKNASKLALAAQTNNGATRSAVVTITAKSGETAKVEVKQAGNEDIQCLLPGYVLVWNDEFDQTSPDLDSRLWRHEVKNQGWVNNELQNYVNGKTPNGARVTEVKDGTLRINCLKEGGKVYSARIYGNVNTGWTYGVFEARIKLPKGKGTWPAWWMMPVVYTSWPHCGEIDIMEEVGADPDKVSSSIHCTAYNHVNNTQKTASTTCKGAEGEFHVYTLEWTADHIQTYVDGKKLFTFTNDKKGSDDSWPFHVAFYPILNLAWGGDWGGYKGVDEKALPLTMEVDYVRVFQK